MRLRTPETYCHDRINDAASGVAAHLGADATQATTDAPYGVPAGLRSVRGKATATVTAFRSTAHTEPRCRARQGVVPYQMPGPGQTGAVKTQAIGARTYATRPWDQNRFRSYQVCDTTLCQVFGGAGAEHPLVNAAVDATASEILTDRGKAAFTQFSSSSGGWTARGVPCLPAQRDPYDGRSGNSLHSWSSTISASMSSAGIPASALCGGSACGPRREGRLGQDGVTRVLLDGGRSDATCPETSSDGCSGFARTGSTSVDLGPADRSMCCEKPSNCRVDIETDLAPEWRCSLV